MSKSYETATVKNLGKSQIEITASIPSSVWESFRSKALTNINQSVTIDGFRKGNIPENILASKVGEKAILEEMAELAVSRAYVDILIDQKIDAIGRPEIGVTKLAPGNPLEFKAKTAIMPEIILPDYKKLAEAEVTKVNPDETKVSDKDIEDAILRIRQSRATSKSHSLEDEKAHADMTPEEHAKAHEKELPELNDDFVQKLGGGFTDVADFRKKLVVMVTEEKKVEAHERRRIRIADAIANETTIDLPEVFIESELNRMEAQFKADIERMGVKFEDYIAHAKKSAEDIRKEWRPSAEKKAKLQLILNEIAKKENIKPTPKEIEAEVTHITQHYKDADLERAQVYAETVLTNEKVFQWLEK